MRRRNLVIIAVVAAAAAGIFVISAASAGTLGLGTWPGMMGGYHGVHGPRTNGAGMMRGYRSASSGARLLIRQKRQHCHAWSLNGGPYRATQSVTLRSGSIITIIDDDVMPHRLVQLAGAPVTMRNGTTMPMMNGYGSRTPGLMAHMGASTHVTFARAGVYRFRTRAGEDYMAGIETTAADNTLTLTVTVR